MTPKGLFFASDVHGSEVCFRKFLSAARVYNVDVLILNGDLTGKAIVPIVKQPDGTFEATFLNRKRTAGTDQELQELVKSVRFSGYYSYIATPEEAEKLRTDKIESDRVFSQLMIETLRDWIRIAEERLKDTPVKCFINAGNDDIPEVDSVLKSSERIIDPEDNVVRIDDRHEMITTGYSNITPWNAPRDIPEEDLAARIDRMASKVVDMKNCIFNFHCPPYDSGLDIAPRLDDDLRPMIQASGIEMAPVGSKAVRDAITKHQPLLGLHGHIHESRAAVKLGRTLCLNPGSEYGEGILRGVLVTLSDARVERHMFTQG